MTPAMPPLVGASTEDLVREMRDAADGCALDPSQLLLADLLRRSAARLALYRKLARRAEQGGE